MANEQNAASVSPKLFPALQGQPAAAEPSLPKVAPGKLTEESKNVFTELFGQDAAAKPGSVMNTVVQQQEKKNVSYFEDKPKEALSLKKFIKHKSEVGSTVLQVSFLLFFLVAGYFLTQNSARFSTFGVNTALRVQNFQEQVDQLEAEVRVQKYLAASLLLDQYVSTADEYLYDVEQANSMYTSQNKRSDYLQAAATAKPRVLDLLSQVQDKLSESIPSEAIPAAVLVSENLVNELRAKSGQVDDQSLLQDIQDLQTAEALLQNQSFQSLIASVVIADVSDEEIQSVFDAYNSLNASSNSIISSIKSTRPEWSAVLDDLELIIKQVDPLFNTEFPGNLLVTDLVFNSDGSVSLSGNTSTADTTNFTLVSNLIDKLEDSPRFEAVEDRSYQKSAGENTYTGDFRIEMQLENNPNTNE